MTLPKGQTVHNQQDTGYPLCALNGCGRKAFYRVANRGYCSKHKTEAFADRQTINEWLSSRAAARERNFVPIHQPKRFKTPDNFVRTKSVKKYGITDGGRILPYIPVATESVKLVRREFPLNSGSGRYEHPQSLKSQCVKGLHYRCLSSNCTCECHRRVK